MYHQQQQQQFSAAGEPQMAQPVRQTEEEGTCCNPRVLLIFSIVLLTIGTSTREFTYNLKLKKFSSKIH